MVIPRILSMLVNESMFGQSSRETAGFTMQYATNQGNVIRRRLFNKYVLLTEAVLVTSALVYPAPIKARTVTVVVT